MIQAGVLIALMIQAKVLIALMIQAGVLIALMIQAVSTSETVANSYGATTQKKAVFIVNLKSCTDRLLLLQHVTGL
jgi:hypothetical protein